MSEAVKLRFEFEKRGKLRYISHLDLLKLMQRVFKRAGVPLWHTEGFNPHPYIAFGQPLSLGQEGLHELVDTKLTEAVEDTDALCAAVNAVCPEGLRMCAAYPPERPVKDIVWGEYETLLPDVSPERIPEMQARLGGESCTVMKKGGKEPVPMDILPYIDECVIESWEGGVRIRSRLACAPSRVLNVSYLVKGLLPGEEIYARNCRVRLLDENRVQFH